MAKEQEPPWFSKDSSWISETVKETNSKTSEDIVVIGGGFLGPRWSLLEKAKIEHKERWLWPRKKKQTKKKLAFCISACEAGKLYDVTPVGPVGKHWTNFRLKENLTIATDHAIKDPTNYLPSKFWVT